jgi:hypothetical protein
MKNIFLVTILLTFAGVVAGQTIIASGQTTTPSCDPVQMPPIKCGYYQEGYLDGENDAKANSRNDWKRYKRKVEKQYESYYRSGYDLGFGSVRPFSRWTDDQKNVYDQGYDDGKDDRNRRISRLPARYEGQYDSVYKAYYDRGYYDGFDNRNKQYDTNVTGTRLPGRLPFPGGNRGSRRGTTTGTARWTGRVDNRVNIVIRGDSITSTSVAGPMNTTFANIQGVLPRRNAVLSVRKRDGRGSARVIQQPGRANSYTGIVQIYDPKRGMDNYSLDISWRASNTQEAYSTGRVTWRGRVDQTVNIKIYGDSVESIDMTNSGMRGVTFDIQGYLAARRGNVRVNKRDGRGTVRILEQPTAQNDYTAVIQIFDPRGGDDQYELEIEW